jgi:hypothetical protein
MDKNINLIFFTLLKMEIIPKKDEILPLDPGKLLKDYMKPLANEMNLQFDFKYSTHKKINNYLKNLSKNENLITFSKQKGMQNDYILSIDLQNDLIKDFKPLIKKIKFLDEKLNQKEDERENVILNKDEKIELIQMFKPNSLILDLFKKACKEYKR